MKTLIVAVLAVCAVTVHAARHVYYSRPGTGKGFVAVVNTQTKVAESNFVEAAECIRDTNRYAFRFFKDAAAAKGAQLTITIVNDPAKPSLVAAPDASWAIVNVAALDGDLKSDTAKAKFLESRARKTFIRAFAYAAGAGGSGYKGNVLDCGEIRDLDYAREVLPMDAAGSIDRHLVKRGMEAEDGVTYGQACEEGWAPPPANEKQRAIFEKVKAEQSAVPTKGLGIKFDPKKGK